MAMHLALLMFLGNRNWGAASTIWIDVLVAIVVIAQLNVGLLLAVLVSFSAAILGAWMLVALPIALLRRTTVRTPVLLLAVALLWMVTAFSLPGALAFPLLPLYLFAALQGICFAWIFLHYDLLTCFAAMLTVSAWLFCFPLLRIFGRVEFWSYVWVMVPWLLFTLLGVVLWFRPELVAWRRRTAAVFE